MVDIFDFVVCLKFIDVMIVEYFIREIIVWIFNFFMKVINILF